MRETLFPSQDPSRIAIVDDDPIVVQAERDLLEADGHLVQSADSIESGIELVRRFKPDLVLLDYMMPEGTGAEVVRAIREFDQLTQVILVSGVSSEQPVRQLLAELDIQGFHYKSDGAFRLLLQVDAVLKHARVLKRHQRQKGLLRYILKVAPDVGKLQPLDELFHSALSHICQLVADPSAALLPDGLILFRDGASGYRVRAATGQFSGLESIEHLPFDCTAFESQATVRGTPRQNGGFIVLPFARRPGQCGMALVYSGTLPYEALDPCRLYLGQLEQAVENVALYERATTDSLTSVFNRGYAEQELSDCLRLGATNGVETSIVLLDIDHFKSINDRFGHAAGDVALRRIAQAMRKSCRQGDLVARFGGEEFLALLPQTSLTDAMLVANRILESVRQLQVVFEGQEVRLTASAGVAVAAGTEFSREDLLRHADRALYHSKAMGRDRASSLPALFSSPPVCAEGREGRRRTGS